MMVFGELKLGIVSQENFMEAFMKVKKIIAGICAATISTFAFTMAAGATAVSKNETAGNTPVSIYLSVTDRQVTATASIRDNPANYETAQAYVTVDYIMKSTVDQFEKIGHVNSKSWGTGGAGCSALADSGYYMFSAKSYNSFNINGSTYSGSRYNLSVN